MPAPDPDWETRIGLEVHVQLKTATKMFCRCRVAYGEPPNTRVCPVCCGLPGVLPTVNGQAVEYALRAALALGCRVAPESRFDRKNYYYPDLPKNYQISQYDEPLATGGHLELEWEGETKTIAITRVHLEEDAGKLLHPEPAGDDEAAEATGSADRSFSLVDLNRAGVPLLEIVSEPELRHPKQAVSYLTLLRRIMRYLEVSDCDMEKGSLRCDANLSVCRAGSLELGTKTEIKNLNSFRFMQQALQHEEQRQLALLREGGTIIQETRLFDEQEGATEPMRTKEEAHDYRYLPEPDLVRLSFAAARVEEARAQLPELPAARRARLMAEYGLSAYDASVLTAERALADYFEQCTRFCHKPKSAANWIMGEVLRECKSRRLELDAFPLSPARLAELIGLLDSGRISHASGKELFTLMLRSRKSAEALVTEQNLEQLRDADALRVIVEKVLQQEAGIVQDYRGGKKAAIKALLGRVMKATRGKAHPGVARQVLEEALQ